MNVWTISLFVVLLGVVGYILRDFFIAKEGFQTARTFTDVVPTVDPNGAAIPTGTKPRYYKYRFQTQGFEYVHVFLKVLYINQSFRQTGQFIQGIYREGSSVSHITRSNVSTGWLYSDSDNSIRISNNDPDHINAGTNPDIMINNLQPYTSYTLVVGTIYTSEFTNLGVSLENQNTKIPMEYIGYSTDLNTIILPISSYNSQIQYLELQRQINDINTDALNYYNGISTDLLSYKTTLNAVINFITNLRGIDASVKDNTIRLIRVIITAIANMTQPVSNETVVNYLSTEYTVNKINVVKTAIDDTKLYMRNNNITAPPVLTTMYNRLQDLDITTIENYKQRLIDIENLKKSLITVSTNVFNRTFTNLVPETTPTDQAIPVGDGNKYYKYRFNSKEFTSLDFFLQTDGQTNESIQTLRKEGSFVSHLIPSNVSVNTLPKNRIMYNSTSNSISTIYHSLTNYANTGTIPDFTINNLQPNTNYTFIVWTTLNHASIDLAMSIEKGNTVIPIEYIGYSLNIDDLVARPPPAPAPLFIRSPAPAPFAAPAPSAIRGPAPSAIQGPAPAPSAIRGPAPSMFRGSAPAPVPFIQNPTPAVSAPLARPLIENNATTTTYDDTIYMKSLLNKSYEKQDTHTIADSIVKVIPELRLPRYFGPQLGYIIFLLVIFIYIGNTIYINKYIYISINIFLLMFISLNIITRY